MILVLDHYINKYRTSDSIILHYALFIMHYALRVCDSNILNS